MADALVIVVTFVAAGFAVWKGGEAERWGAALVVAALLVYMVILALANRAATAYAVDGILLLGFVSLLLRFRAPWLMSAVFVRLGAAPLHMLILSGEGGIYRIVSQLNLPAYLTLACLALGVVERRRRLARERLRRGGGSPA